MILAKVLIITLLISLPRDHSHLRTLHSNSEWYSHNIYFFKLITLISLQLKAPKREQYVGSASKTMSRMSLDQFQQKKMSGAASVSSVSRYGLKKGRFNEDFSQHHVAQRTGSSVSGVHQNKLSKITKSISKHQGQNNLTLMQP